MKLGGGSARVNALMGKMSLGEKLGQISMLADGLVETGPPGPHNPFNMIVDGRVGSLLNVWGAHLVREAQRRAVEESRLGVPLFFGLDVVHGHKSIHPVPIAEAGSFDRQLWEATARDSAIEAMADGIHMTFAPMIDVARDARWGRIVETAGEDPLVNAEFGRARVRGYQARDEKGIMRLASCAKHFCAYGAVVSGRDYAEADVSWRGLEEVYLPPFRACVDEGVAAIMPAFIDVAGMAMTGHKRLLRDMLRARWRFDGLIISDYNAIAELINHGVAADAPEAAALALNAGVDIDMMSDAYFNGLPIALERGLVSMDQIDLAVRRVLNFKEQIGLFDDPYRNMAPSASKEEIPKSLAPERRALSRQAAQRSIVLLKNEGALLPLKAPRTLAVLGPLADAPNDQLGPWASAGDGADAVTILTGLRETYAQADVRFAKGAPFEGRDEDELEAARNAMQGADAIILCIGESRMMSGEALSRTKPEVPEGQLELARMALESGVPVVLAINSGRPLVLPDWLVEGACAILAAWHSGTEAGPALAAILSGACNPSAKLAITWPRTTGQMPLFYGLRPSGRPHDPQNGWTTGYSDCPFDPCWSFGQGLSYTRFTRANLRVDRDTLDLDDLVSVSVDVTNAGTCAGVETIFLFSRDPVAQVTRPMLELRDFTKVALRQGETRTVVFVVKVRDLCYLDEDRKPRLDDGAIQFHVGASARREDLDRIDIVIAQI